MNASNKPSRIAIVGGGVTGLAAAHRLWELDPTSQLTVFEATGDPGGALRTEPRDGFLVEHGADMFTTREPWALELCERIGLADELLKTNDKFRRAFVVRRGRLYPVPAGFTLMTPSQLVPLLTTSLLSVWGKARMFGEMFVARRMETDDESLADFVRRRLGKEAFERLVQPLVGGIYTADPEKLSMAATMQQFVRMEREHGSLIRAVRREKPASGGGSQGSGARYGMFVAPERGMQQLIDRLVQRLPAGVLRLDTPIRRLAAGAGGTWTLHAAGEPIDFDAVLLATSAPRTADLMRDVDATLADQLAGIDYAGAAVVVLGYRREQIGHPLNGFGFVVPHVEGRKLLAGSFSSVKFPGRAPQGHVLLRGFVGGALQPELLEWPDPELRKLVLRELSELLRITGTPLFCDVHRWTGAMPQYHVGHLERVRRIEDRVAGLPGLELAGNAYRGVGVPFCIHDGESAAARIIAS